MTMIRSGFASNAQGPTMFLPPGKVRNPVFSDEFLRAQGAPPYSTVVMTPNGFLTDEAWVLIVPHLIKGTRAVVTAHAKTLGIDEETANKLLVGMTFDGFKTHLKNLDELINMADANILAVVEGRDSSEINQPFDRFVARAGKRRAAITLEQVRRSHITPVVDIKMLMLVGLQMLRDCAQSRVWENSFIACNLHPHHRISVKDWLKKIGHFVVAAEKFEDEVIDDRSLLPSAWNDTPLAQRQKWLRLIAHDGAVPSWDVDLIQKLRDAGMPLALISNMFKIYAVERRLEQKLLGAPSTLSTPSTPKSKPQKVKVTPNNMIYHLFKVNVPGMSPIQRFQHAVTVRNRTYGPKATTPSPYLDLEITADNRKFLKLRPEDVNMHRVLQVSLYCMPLNYN